MAIPAFLTKLFKPKTTTDLTGTQRPLSQVSVSIARNWDLEIPEIPIREPSLAHQLLEMATYCYEVRHTSSILVNDVFCSSDGDTQGWTIADTLDDNETPVNAELKAIALDLINRHQNHEKMIIGGDELKKALDWTLNYGDCFLEIAIEREGIGRNDYGISKSLYLPTWEMFRQESDRGDLLGFEQRRHISSHDPSYFFYPHQIVHFRYEPSRLYGNSLFFQSLQYWGKLKEATENLANAARDLGINPNLHILPEGFTQSHLQQYKGNYENTKQGGMITDIYTASGIEIRKMANINPDLTSLINNVLQWRYYMIPPGVPTYLFPGLQAEGGTKELSREPARAYSRYRYKLCQLISKGIKQMIDTEVILKKGLDWYSQNARGYRIIFPQWQIDGMESADGKNATDESELEKEKSKSDDNHKQK